jgi:cyanophycin synthetase
LKPQRKSSRKQKKKNNPYQIETSALTTACPADVVSAVLSPTHGQSPRKYNMKILDLKVMSGPNIWSNYRQRLIVMTLDLEELEQRPTHRIDGFGTRLRDLMPSLYGHRCSEANKGGFFQRVEQGTWMGHVIEHLALEMQTLAGMDCGYGRTRSTDREGVYHVVFAYRVKEAGLYVAKAAVELARALVRGASYDLEKDILALREIARKKRLPTGTLALIEEAHQAEIPYHLVNDQLLLLGYGVKQVKMRPNLSGTGSAIGLEIARHHHDTATILAGSLVSVNLSMQVKDEDDINRVFAEFTPPIVLKPARGNHHRHYCLLIDDAGQARAQLEKDLEKYGEVIAEPFLQGDLFRFLVLNYRVAAVLRYRRTTVTGDGQSALSQLHAQPPGRHDDPVPGKGQKAVVDGVSEEYDGEVHASVAALASRAAAVIGLNLCAVDVISNDISGQNTTREEKVIGVDGTPDISAYVKPQKGNGRNIFLPLFDMLFPGHGRGRIPVVAVRGNGEQHTIMTLIAEVLEKRGLRTGVAGSQGIFLSGGHVSRKDAGDFHSVRSLLFDPGIEAAIVECPTAAILEHGLPFDGTEISIITGRGRKKSARDKESALPERKADLVVGRTTGDGGFTILNADNGCEELGEELYSQLALYSVDPGHPAIALHCRRGGKAAVLDNGLVTLCDGKWKTGVLSPGESISPASPEALLPAVLAAWLLGVDAAQIGRSLTTRFAATTEKKARP